MGNLLFAPLLLVFPLCFSAEARLNSTSKAPVSLKAHVALELLKKAEEPFRFEFQIENVSDKSVVLNMWFAQPEVETLGPKSLIDTKKINVPIGKRRPPNESDILRLAPGERKTILAKHWAHETFPYFASFKDQVVPTNDRLAYVLKDKGSYNVSFCWTFIAMSNPFLKSEEAFWQGRVCSPETTFEVKSPLPKNLE